jgi:hypothetical protein
MKNVDDYLKVRHAVRIEGLSERAAARRFGIDPRTVNKMMKFSVPPGYRRKKPHFPFAMEIKETRTLSVTRWQERTWPLHRRD